MNRNVSGGRFLAYFVTTAKAREAENLNMSRKPRWTLPESTICGEVARPWPMGLPCDRGNI